MKNVFCVYIMSSQYNTTLYTGVTSDLRNRVRQHKDRIFTGFTRKYKVHKLVYYEICSDPDTAIKREKQIKAGSRKKKEELIESVNSGWRDLYEDLL